MIPSRWSGRCGGEGSCVEVRHGGERELGVDANTNKGTKQHTGAQQEAPLAKKKKKKEWNKGQMSDIIPIWRKRMVDFIRPVRTDMTSGHRRFRFVHACRSKIGHTRSRETQEEKKKKIPRKERGKRVQKSEREKPTGQFHRIQPSIALHPTSSGIIGHPHRREKIRTDSQGEHQTRPAGARHDETSSTPDGGSFRFARSRELPAMLRTENRPNAEKSTRSSAQEVASSTITSSRSDIA